MEEPKEASDAETPPAKDQPQVALDARESLRYSVDLFDAFAAVCEKAKNGVQSCHAIAAFIQERANMEAAYARSMSKIATNAKADDWAPAFAKCWLLVQETLAGLAKVHTDSASKMQSTMVAGVRAFAAQQEIQVQRLVAEGTKCRTAQQNMLLSVDRAKEKYDKRCVEAIDLAASLRRAEAESSASSQSDSASPGAAPSVPTPAVTNEEGGSDESVGQLLTKMWDTTSAFAKPSAERQRSKLEACMDELVLLEKTYTQIVEHVNTQRLVIEREIAENLHAFQLTEEQRIEYLKDLFHRLQKLILSNLEASQLLFTKLREETADINEFGDIEDGFRKLSHGIDPDAELVDPTDHPFYQRMCQVQAMSERGHQTVRVIHTTLHDLACLEDHFVSSTQRLLRAHEANAANGGDLFNLSSALNQVSGEGETMRSGWKSVKEQTQRYGDAHLELRSLIAEPVILNISTMKQEYEASRSATHEHFAKAHGALCHEATLHQKRKQRVDLKTKEFVQLFTSLPDMGGIDLRNVDTTQALVVVQQLSGTFTEKEKRTEAKLKVVAEELRDAQQKAVDSSALLSQRFTSYVQDVDVFISVYMKNEKFRLQVEKSSMVSLSKALDRTVESGTSSATQALSVIEQIDSTADVADFIQAHRRHREKAKKILLAYTTDASLKDLLEEHRRQRASMPPLRKPADADDKKTPRPAERKVNSNLKRTNSHPSTPSTIDRGIKSSVSSIEEDRDQPMAMSDFQKKFKLDGPEQIVESYSCALYANNFPNHGRMYLTRDHLCFAGWRDTIYVVSYTDITMMEKKNTAIIVPNAIEITANGEKAFFTSFVFRDECLQCILQLQGIKKATADAMLETSPSIPAIDTASDPQPNGDAEEIPSPVSHVQVAPVASSKESEVAPARVATDATSVVEAPPQAYPVPGRDAVLDDYEVVIDEDAPFSVDFAYDTLWIKSAAFMQKLLEDGGDTSITIGSWDESPVTYTAVNISDSFHGSRRVAYTHNKKYMVGPSSIPTEQQQRFKWDPHVRLVVSVTTLVSDVPYSDYFRAENRWVFSNTPKNGTCRIQVGVRIHWLKSTWLKKQIESTAMGEARESTRVLVTAAIAAARFAATPINHVVPSLTSSPAPSADKISVADKPSESASESTSTAVEREPTKPLSSSPSRLETAQPMTLAATTLPHVAATSSLSLLQIANIVCVVIVVLSMYRISTTLDQMQAITRETLFQQRQQQEFLRELLSKLGNRQ